MPLQWLPLDLSRYDKPRVGAGTPQLRTPISEALSPQRTQGSGVSGMTSAPMSLSESAKDRSSRQAKANKEEEERWRNYYEEMGRKAAAKYEAGQERARQISMGREEHKRALQLAKAGATPELTKENMPEAAIEVWKFISTLEPESQKFFIQQLKQKEQPTGGFIEAGGVRKEMPGSVGMYGWLVDGGYIDPATDTIIEKKPEEMKGRYDIEGGYIYNTVTGKREKLSVDEPTKAIDEINADANAGAIAITKAAPTEASFVEAKYDILVDGGMNETEAAELSKIKELPEGAKKTPWYKNLLNWIGKGAPKITLPGKKGISAITFNEANVTSLVPVISDDVTEAERAHLKSQGASDSDINEAIKRKVGE